MDNVRTIPTGAHWGVYEVDVDGDTIVSVRPSAQDDDPTPLHRSLPEIVAHKTRISRPMVRADYLARGIASDRSGRGREPFVPISWDRALDLVAGEINRVKAAHGNAAIFAGSYGWASSGRLHHPRTLLKRLLNLHGGFTDHVLDYSRAAASVIVPRVLGTMDPVAVNLTTWDSIIANAELIVSFGGMAPKNFQIDSGGMGVHRGQQWMQAIRDAGIGVVYVGPYRDDISDTLDADWLSIRPGTDTALMLGLAHTLHAEQLHDTQFLGRYCVGFPIFARYLTGEADGIAKSAEWAAPLCDVPAETIRTLARRMAAKRTMITLSYSLQRADHGEQPMWMGIVLAAMLGQIGLPGGGFGIGYGSMGTKGMRRAPVPLRAIPTGDNPTGSRIPVARISDMLLSPGQTIDFNGERITYPDIRMIYWGGGNPFHHHQDINRLLQAWRKPETIVVQDFYWTPAARHADIVLPVATPLERNDVSAGWLDNTVYAMRKAIEPIGEARSDYDIVCALADRLGHRAAFSEGRGEMEWIRYLYESLRTQIAAGKEEIPPFEVFWERGRIEIPVPQRPYVLFEEFRNDPAAHPLKTPSGRIEIFSETIAGFGYADCPGHPIWIEPCEWLGSDLTRRFPLHMISNQPSTRLHSQMDQASLSGALKVQGREPIWMHPDDAARRSIGEGNVVRVYNDRGACLAGARLTSALRPGVVQLSTGAWYDPAEPGQVGTLDKHGNPNMLTLDKGTSKLAQGPIAHSVLVEIEAWRGPLPPVTAHAPPEIVEASPA
jgi:biotin/methionine sulfoxide reductase